MLDAYWQPGIVPIDPARIAKDLGVEVFEKPLGREASGVLFKDLDKDPMIVLNSEQNRVRKRFTCSHEIGHFIQNSKLDKIEYVDFRNNLSSLGTDEGEVFANAFAAGLLMPREDVEAAVRKGLTPFEIASLFEVSLTAMENRLNTLDLEARDV